MRHYDYASANGAWVALVRDLLTCSMTARPRGQLTREYLGTQLVFDAQLPLVVEPARALNYRFAVAEALWMILGRCDVAPLARVNPKMRDFSDDGAILAGAYGPRFREQLPYVLETLYRDPDSRQAVVEIWRPSPGTSRDVPCTLSWQFLLRRGCLDMIATMRSSDAWLGVPYDAFSFSVVLQLVAGLVGAGPGRVVMNLGSSHLYERDFAAAEAVPPPSLSASPGAPEVFLHPMTEDEFAYFETDANHALDHGSVIGLNLDWDADLPAGWDRLLRAACSRNSAEALGALRGEA